MRSSKNLEGAIVLPTGVERLRASIAARQVLENLKLIGADRDLGSIVAHRTIDESLAAGKD